MGRVARFALIAAALLFVQHAAQLHAFSHLKRENAPARLAGGSLPGCPQPQCLSLDSLGCPLPGPGGPPMLAPPSAFATPAPALGAPRALRIEVRSQSPPSA